MSANSADNICTFLIAPPIPKECSGYKECENARSDNEGLLDTGPPVRSSSFDKAEDALLLDVRAPVRPALFDQIEDAASDNNEVLLTDGGPSVQPASFDQAEDAESNNKVAPPDLPVQTALFNQVEVSSSRTSLKVTLADDLYGQHASGMSAEMNRRQLRRGEYTVKGTRVLFDGRFYCRLL